MIPTLFLCLLSLDNITLRYFISADEVYLGRLDFIHHSSPFPYYMNAKISAGEKVVRSFSCGAVHSVRDKACE